MVEEKMQLGGNIKISGPELNKHQVYVEKDKVEFTLETKKGEKLGINDFSVFLKMDEDKAVVFSTDLWDGEALNDDIVIIMVSGKKSFELGVSFEQAVVLTEIFQKYIAAWYAVRFLKKEHEAEPV